MQQRVQAAASCARERMGRCARIYLLPRKHIEARRDVAEAFHVRQMRVQVECRDTREKMQTVQLVVDLDRCRGPVGLRSGMQAEAVLDRHAEAGQQRAGEAAEALLRRFSMIPSGAPISAGRLQA